MLPGLLFSSAQTQHPVTNCEFRIQAGGDRQLVRIVEIDGELWFVAADVCCVGDEYAEAAQ